MDKLLQDIEKLCMMSMGERKEMYRKSEELWTEQELEDWEMAIILDHVYLKNLDIGDLFHDIDTVNIVELLAKLDRELSIYNSML